MAERRSARRAKSTSHNQSVQRAESLEPTEKAELKFKIEKVGGVEVSVPGRDSYLLLDIAVIVAIVVFPLGLAFITGVAIDRITWIVFSILDLTAVLGWYALRYRKRSK